MENVLSKKSYPGINNNELMRIVLYLNASERLQQKNISICHDHKTLKIKKVRYGEHYDRNSVRIENEYFPKMTT